MRTSPCGHPGQWGKLPSSADRLFNCNTAAVREPPPDKRAPAGPMGHIWETGMSRGPPTPWFALSLDWGMAGMLTEAECIEPNMPTANSGGFGLPLLPYLPAAGEMFRLYFRKVLKIWLTVCPQFRNHKKLRIY